MTARDAATLALAALAAGAASGCSVAGGDGREGDGLRSAPRASTVDGRPAREAPLVGVSFDVEHRLRQAELRALQDAAARRGARLRVVYASGDAGTQHDQLLRLLDVDRVDAVIAVAQDRRRVLDAVRAANRRGVPFVALDRRPAPDAGSTLAATVTGDPEADGGAAADVLQDTGEPLRVLHLWGALNDDNALGRREGFNAQAARGQVGVAAQARTDWVPERARTATLRAFRADPRLDAVFVPSDFVLPGVLGALRELGRLYPRGHPRHVRVVTIDGDPVGCAALKAGYVDADVATPVAELARRALDAALTAAKRPDAPRLDLELPGTVVTAKDRRRAWGCRAR